MAEEADFEKTIQKTFYILPKHLEFLNNINENPNLALRTLLNSIMRTDKKNKIKAAIEQSMLYICFGLIFFILAFLSTDIVAVVATLIGVFLLVYGLIGGVESALPRARRRA